MNTLPICPITNEIMKDPVTTPDGNTYERQALLTWLSTNKTEPLTRNRLSICNLIPNKALKEIYDKYIEEKDEQPSLSYNIENLELNISTVKINSIYRTLFSVKSPDTLQEYQHDFVVCLDISGSMDLFAEAIGGEQSGLTRFNIVKHSTETLIRSCNDLHRVSIITFSNIGEIKSNLIRTTEEGKEQLISILENITTGGCTNLYDGIIKSFSVIKNKKNNIKSSIIIFTDGEPNQDPPRGYIPQLRKYKNENNEMYPCSVSIFAYGTQVNSQLSFDISKETEGIFGYIPDASFIGDLLEHKISNDRTIKAKNCQIKIKNQIINVGDVMFGQSRDFVIDLPDLTNLECELVYYENNSDNQTIITTSEISQITDLDLINYHYIRQRIPLVINKMIIDSTNRQLIHSNFINELEELMTNPNNLITDIYSDFSGQIQLAISPKFYSKWGVHYLLSISRAYELQICNNYKDHGIQEFGGKLFKQILDETDDIFTQIPPPKPTTRKINSYYTQVQPQTTPIDMTIYQSRYNNACFHGLSQVLMCDYSYKNAQDIIKGDLIRLGNGFISEIECVVKTLITNNNLIVINNKLHITPYHPIKLNNKWEFPINLPHEKSNIECNAIYSFILIHDKNNNYNNYYLSNQENIGSRGYGFGMIIDYIECATLAHGITNEDEPFIIVHPFFGTELIVHELLKSNIYESGLVTLNENSIIRQENIAFGIKY